MNRRTARGKLRSGVDVVRSLSSSGFSAAGTIADSATSTLGRIADSLRQAYCIGNSRPWVLLFYPQHFLSGRGSTHEEDTEKTFGIEEHHFLWPSVDKTIVPQNVATRKTKSVSLRALHWPTPLLRSPAWDFITARRVVSTFWMPVVVRPSRLPSLGRAGLVYSKRTVRSPT